MESIQEIDPSTIKCMRDPIFAELKFINATPWWGGRQTPKTVVCMDEQCQEIYYSMPSSSSIKGVIRYLLRLTVACLIPNDELNRKGYEACELFPHGIIDEFPRDAPSLLELIFGSSDRVRGRQGLIGIDVEARIRDECHPLYISLNTIKRIIDTNDLKMLEIEGARILRDDVRNLRSCIDKDIQEFCQLITIPRIRLMLQKYEKDADAKEILERLPIRENCVELYVRLSLFRNYLILNRNTIKLPITFIELLKTLITYLLVFGLTIHGLGKATSRGFGKFVLSDVTRFDVTNDEAREFLHRLNTSLRNLDIRSIERLVDKIISLTKSLTNEYLRILGLDREVSIVPPCNIVNVPRLCNIKLSVIDEPVHPCPVAQKEMIRKGNITDDAKNWCREGVRNRKSARVNECTACNKVLKALSAIGKACLKSTWKMHSGEDPREPGFSYHTWCLGLPRLVNDSSSGWLTGYIVAHLGILSRNNCNRIKSHVSNWCVDYYSLKHAIDNRELKRWRSPIIFTPLIGTDNKLRIAVLYFKTKDLESLIKGIPTREGDIVKIVHVGIHRTCKKHHVIDLQDGIKKHCQTINSSCGSEHVGVTSHVENTVSIRDVSDVCDVAYSWVKWLLGGD